MNDPTEPRTSLLLPPSSFSYFIFTFLDRRKSANLWVIRPLCRVDPHRAQGSGLIERYGAESRRRLIPHREGGLFPFRTPSPSPLQPTVRLTASSFTPRRREQNDFSRRISLSAQGLLLASPAKGFQSSCAGEKEVAPSFCE